MKRRGDYVYVAVTRARDRLIPLLCLREISVKKIRFLEPNP